MKKFTLVICSLVFSLLASGQNLGFVYDGSIPVKELNNSYDNPWFGAFQAPQFGRIDMNGDGKKDLFVFDKYDNTISIFLNDNNTWKYAHGYQDLFPDLIGWVVLRDYNCDGKNDIFTYSLSNVALYKNTSNGSNISFEKVSEALTAQGSRISIPFSDVPAIDDVDQDGDLDILTFDAGGSYIIYYRNQRVENGLGCDELSFVLDTKCWGDFKEGGLSNDITLGDDCGGQIANPFGDVVFKERSGVHAGSSLMIYDDDGDNEMD